MLHTDPRHHVLLGVGVISVFVAACSSSSSPTVVRDAGNSGGALDSQVSSAGSGGAPQVLDGSGGGAGAVFVGGAGGIPAVIDSGTTGGGPNDASGGFVQPEAGTDASAGPYPAGPYGIRVGDVFQDLTLKGYVVSQVRDSGSDFADGQPWTDSYSLEALRSSGAPYALIHVSAFFCPGCRHAANDLGRLGKSVIEAGGQVVEILSWGATRTQATQSDLVAWIEAYDLDVTTMLGDSTVKILGQSFREYVYIVELSTMKILYAVHGDTTGQTASSIAPAVAEMHTLLGK